MNKPDMYELVWRERRIMSVWLAFHLLCVTFLLIGLFFVYQYMTMPDHVIVLARDSSVYLGNSASVESGRVIKDIALRAAYALLSRRYDVGNERMLEFVFTKRGRGQAKGYLNDTQEMFETRFVYQEIESSKVDFSLVNGQYHALVKGVLVRSGVYFGHSYVNRRDFALMMRLERSGNDIELPFKVAGMRYWEEEQE
ncbi:MAG: hypothetical protein PHV82_18210 [Victivallaceae bacterium]|nr:hypothetical protein [Victivallaceae bacterium]